MNTSTTTNPTESGRRLIPQNPRQRGLIAGIFLIGIGALLFLSQVLQVGWLSMLILPLMGIGFIVWGVLVREVGLMVPGGILTGLGGAIFVQSQQWPQLSGLPTVSLLMFGLAAGFVIATLLSPLAGRRLAWGLLIPSAIFAALGVLFTMGDRGLEVLQTIGTLWPLVLIAVGVGVLWRVARNK